MAAPILLVIFLFLSNILFFASSCSISSSSSSPNILPTRSDHEISLLYEGWLVKHNKYYSYKDPLKEKEKRYAIFKDNLNYIDEHNAGNHTYSLGLNVFADLTVDEYRATYLRTMPPKEYWKQAGQAEAGGNETSTTTTDSYNFDEIMTSTGAGAAPDSIDWRDMGAIGPVGNQGGCNSCWAFALLTAVEAINKIVTGDLIILSVQQLVDCFNKGCHNAYIDDAFEYIIKNGGIDTEEDYPYKAVYGHCDKFKENTKVVSIDGYKRVIRSEYQLKSAVAKQPVAALVEGYGQHFQLYTGGIFTKYCGTKVDHAVAIVGYGTESGQDYWIIKNSWGTGWGESGYMKMERNIKSHGGKCGIATWCYYPIKHKNMGEPRGVKTPATTYLS